MINIYSCIILGHIQPNVRNLGTPVFHGIFNRRSVRKQRNHIGQDKPTRYNRYRTKIWHVHARIRFSRIRIGKSRGMWDYFCSIICLDSTWLVLLNTVNTLQFSGHFVYLNRYASFLFCSNCCSSLSRELVEVDLKLFYAIPFWQFFSFKLSINRFIYCMSHRKRKYWIWTLTIIRRFFFVKLTCHISFSSCDFFSVTPFAKSVLVKSRLSNSRFNITIWEHI